MDRYTSLRFFDKVQFASDGCWLWTAGVDGSGYGNFRANGRKVSAHRWMYVAMCGAVPAGLELDHLCRNRRCVNFAHLEPVTHKLNIQRALHYRGGESYSRQIRCRQGHLLMEGNLVYDRSGARRCLICYRAKEAARNERRKAERARQRAGL